MNKQQTAQKANKVASDTSRNTEKIERERDWEHSIGTSRLEVDRGPARIRTNERGRSAWDQLLLMIV
jgi:hypothetical protein